ncbi:11562_t:CDS:2, partial [Scutellospora calospora]
MKNHVKYYTKIISITCQNYFNASNPNTKHYRPVTVLVVELALKEFVLNYQHKTILSNAILIEKAKLLAARLEVPKGTLQFSSCWLQKFKECNCIQQVKLQDEAISIDNVAIVNILLLIRSKCTSYPLDRIYNMDETRLFYQLELDHTFATHCIARYKVNREHISIALCVNADGSHKLNLLVIGKYQKLSSEINNLVTIIENLYFSNPIQVEEFLSISDETLAYEVPNDDYAISELVKIFKESNTIEDSDNIDEIDDSLEVPIVSTDSALE